MLNVLVPHARILNTQLTLMTYYGIVLLVAGFQADEARIIKQYDRMLTK